MFVTRPRSLYRNLPAAALTRPPSEAPSSGFIVISDEESEEMDTFCWGICKNDRINRLPFPQDRFLKIVHTQDRDQEASISKVWLLPVPDQPLSSNRYYVISAKGYHKGKAYTCSKEDDFVTACCYNNVRDDPKPKPFDHRDVYQQFEIRHHKNGGFYAVPVAWDGTPPKFLRKGGWEVHVAHSFNLRLGEAQGLRVASLSHAPGLDFPLSSRRSSPVVLGKWFSPFVYVKEMSTKVKEQMKTSLFYELTLKRWWEQIFSSENDLRGGGENSSNVVVVNACVKRLTTSVYGMEAEKEDRYDADGFIYFRAKARDLKKGNVGLSSAVYEKIKWLQDNRGWFDSGAGKDVVRVRGENVIHTDKGWRKFASYVLVESFILRRMDGNLVINFNFRNTDRVEHKCE
ncbi:OLC1v1009918C1 [Oldenlandia corymbosa var. corymbosa]|uniref:OLC1v1009918C1 n=1 Tax=Oldenlandia corymbosa var. corymbosa TaxID=529605 RepID=A0AAV1DQK9_OLDCO|nr:OLC1v1009918C1 [Oldenlandia corymbosa var. corymbosa]